MQVRQQTARRVGDRAAVEITVVDVDDSDDESVGMSDVFGSSSESDAEESSSPSVGSSSSSGGDSGSATTTTTASSGMRANMQQQAVAPTATAPKSRTERRRQLLAWQPSLSGSSNSDNVDGHKRAAA